MTPRRYAVAAWLFELGPSGATERLTTLLAALPALLGEDEEVVVLGGRQAPQIEGLRAITTGIPPAPSWRRALAEQWRLPRLLRDLGASLLHLESLPVPRRLPCPVALTVHDLRDLGPYRRRSSARFLRTLRTSARRAEALFVPSRFTAGELAQVVGHADVSVVPGAIELPVAATDRPSRDVLLHVGHLEPRKNLTLLLRAYAAATRRHWLPPLCLAGRDAGEGSALRALAAALGVGASVQFLGSVSSAALARLYDRAVAVLVPSRYEGFGMPALAALARGVPVVVSDQAALVELVRDQATVVPGDQVDAWADVLAALSNGATTHQGGLARAREFGAEVVASQLLAHWRRIVALTPTQPASTIAR